MHPKEYNNSIIVIAKIISWRTASGSNRIDVGLANRSHYSSCNLSCNSVPLDQDRLYRLVSSLQWHA